MNSTYATNPYDTDHVILPAGCGLGTVNPNWFAVVDLDVEEWTLNLAISCGLRVKSTRSNAPFPLLLQAGSQTRMMVHVRLLSIRSVDMAACIRHERRNGFEARSESG